MTQFLDEFSEDIWKQNYCNYKDTDVDSSLRRVAKAIASVEKTEKLQEEWQDKFYDMLSDFKVTVGGRIYANAGTSYKGTTLLNCFTSPRASHDIDSLAGILEDVKNQVFTLKSEGGWGQNFSWIRPRGAFIHGIGVETPGAIKYMELYDKSSDIITAGSGRKSTNKKSKGKIRKGAQMAVLDCFSKNTEILTSEGWVNVVDVVEMLEEGKIVLAKSEYNTSHLALRPIVKPQTQLYKVEVEDGSFIETTGEHKFVVKNIITNEEYLKALLDIDVETEYIQTIG
jgi:ribonucleotide reductase alpha subunit